MRPPNVRINDVVHGGKGALRATPCGILWVPGVMIPPTFPRGEPTEDEVDCMACVAYKERR